IQKSAIRNSLALPGLNVIKVRIFCFLLSAFRLLPSAFRFPPSAFRRLLPSAPLLLPPLALNQLLNQVNSRCRRVTACQLPASYFHLLQLVGQLNESFNLPCQPCSR